MPTTTGSAPSAARCAAALCRAAPRITGTAKHTGIACAGLSWRRSADQSQLLPLPPRRRGITPPPVCHHRRLCPRYAPRLKRASLLPPGAASEQSSTPRESWFRALSSLGHCRRAQAYSRRRQQQQQQPHRLRAPARLQARKTRPTRAACRVISPIVLVQRLPLRRVCVRVRVRTSGGGGGAAGSSERVCGFCPLPVHTYPDPARLICGRGSHGFRVRRQAVC